MTTSPFTSLTDTPLDFAHVVARWSLPVMVLDRDLCFVYANASYILATRTAWDDIEGRHVFDVFPDEPERVASVFQAFEGALAGVQTKLSAQPYVLVDENGQEQTHYWQCVQEPVFDNDGQISHVLQYAQDVSDRVLAELSREIIAGELNHRVKNIISVIQSIARMSARGQSSVPDYSAELIARIGAMSRNNDRLYANAFEGSSLSDILNDELDALMVGGGERVSLSGDEVSFGPVLSRDLSMVVHELATNAAKYGCFAHAGGTLSVSWTVQDKMVNIAWREQGVGPVSEITETGFGSKMIRMMRGIACTRTPTDDGLWIDLAITLTDADTA